MAFIDCSECAYAEELYDGSYYCPYCDSFKCWYMGCSYGIRGCPRLADSYIEQRYEEWLSLYPYKAADSHTDPPSLLRAILDWLSNRRKKEESK